MRPCPKANAPPSIPKNNSRLPHGRNSRRTASPHPRTKKGGPASPPFSYLVSRRYFMRNFMGSMDSEGKNRSRNSTSISTIRKGAMFRTKLPILMFPMPQTT